MSFRTVLVVDDAADCVATLELALSANADLEVTGAGSAEEALGILETRAVSGVVTDLQLPAMSGLELIARIRDMAGLRHLPIVVISANADPSAPATALRMGANAFFAKPFSPSAVRKKLEELVYASSPASPNT